MDLGSGTKKVLMVIMWIVLALGAICGIVYCCYWGYEYTIKQRPPRDRGRRVQAVPTEPDDVSRASHEGINLQPRKEEPEANGIQGHRHQYRAVRHGRRHRARKISESSSDNDERDHQLRGRGRHRRDKKRKGRKVYVKLVRGSLDNFTK